MAEEDGREEGEVVEEQKSGCVEYPEREEGPQRQAGGDAGVNRPMGGGVGDPTEAVGRLMTAAPPALTRCGLARNAERRKNHLALAWGLRSGGDAGKWSMPLVGRTH